MNRLLSLIVCFSILLASFTVSGSVEATGTDSNETIPQNIWVEYDDSVNCWIKTLTTQEANNNAFLLQPYNDIDGVFVSELGEYYMQVDQESLIKVNKKTYPLSSYSSFQEISKLEIPPEVLKDIASMAAFTESNDCKNANVILFTKSDGLTRDNVLPRETTYYNGKTFYHYKIYFTNCWTGFQTISQGTSTTQAVLTTIKELTMLAISTYSSTIGTISSIYNAGRNCLQDWQASTGLTPIYCNSLNHVDVDICPDIYLKYTYYYDPVTDEELLGCSSQRAIIKQIDTNTYLYDSSGGTRVENSIYPYATFSSPHYVNPESTAYTYRYATWTETVHAKVYNKTIYFSHPDFDWPSSWPQ